MIEKNWKFRTKNDFEEKLNYIKLNEFYHSRLRKS